MRKLKFTFFLLGLGGLLGGIAACHNAKPGAKRPPATPSSTGPTHLTDVSLFPNGLGVFEYQGVVNNNATQTLTFRGYQINDVLGSMVFQDSGGGKVGEITFPTQTPLPTLLQAMRVDLNGSPSRLDMLAQLRGITVTLVLRHSHRRHITGRVIDIKPSRALFSPLPLAVKVGETRPMLQRAGWVINLLCGGTIRQVRVGKIAAITIRNAAVRESFNRALDTLAAQTDRRSHPVTLWFRGHGSRRVGFAYLTETPVWRMTYRLIEPMGKPELRKIKPLHGPTAILQGMAIVSNQSNADWHDVRLDIRGGEPLSFLTNLYQPLFSRRLIQPQPVGLFTMPQTYDRAAGGYAHGGTFSAGQYRLMQRDELPEAFATAPGDMRSMSRLAAAAAISGHAAKMAFQIRQASALPFNPLQGVQAMAEAGKARPAFDYHVDHISVGRGQSAMAPVLVVPIKTQPVDDFSAGAPNTPADQTPYPFLSLRVNNNTGKFLPAGPVAVYQGAMLAGQAALPGMSPGQRHTVRFALDLAVKVVRKSYKENPRQEIKVGITAGMLEQHFIINTTYIYIANNSATSARTLVLHSHMRSRGFVAASAGVKAALRHGHWRFTITLPANKHTAITLHGRLYSQNTRQLAAWGRHEFALFLKKHPAMPPAIVAAIVHGQKLAAAVDSADNAIAVTNARLTGVNAITTNLEQSLAALRKTTPAYNDMASLLSKQNSLFIQLTGQLALQNKTLSTAQQAVTQFWNGVNIAMQPTHVH